MDPFNRLLWRDLWGMRGQVLAIVLVIASGVGTSVMAGCSLESLKRAQAVYYSQFQFADLFAHLKRAPASLESRVREIPGIAEVETRVVVTVKVDVPGLLEPATAKLISIPEGTRQKLNQLHLRSGRSLEPGRTGEILISEGFAKVHRLTPGDSVRAVINGRLRRLTIVGVALSPEFIFQIREGDILPDDRRFGVFWISQTELAAAYDLRGAFNDLTCRLTPSAIEADVVRRLDLLIAPHGGLGAVGRLDQSSHKFVTNELQELRGMAVMVPTLFLLISAFLLNMVVSRLIAIQREQIATLKAFGYTRFEVAFHYIKLVLLFVALGVGLGVGFGWFLGVHVTRLYSRFFHFPVFQFYLDPAIVSWSSFVTAAAALVGTLNSVWRASALPPAAAMRPEPPARCGPSFLERLGLERVLTEPLKLVLRKLERQPVKSLLTCLGISLAVAVLILGSFMLDAVDYAIHAQYDVAMREDLTVAFIEPSSSRIVHALRALPGVRHCESFRAISVRLRKGPRVRRVEVLGLQPAAELHRLIDLHGREIAIPSSGLVLSEKLGEVLGLRIGDSVRVEVLEGRRPEVDLRVVGMLADFAGIAAYLNRDMVNRLMGESDLVSGVFLAASPGRIEPLHAELKRAPRVASVMVKGSTLRSFRETVGENILRMRSFVALFASVIAVGVVFNSARISLAERSRELATLRVIGFTRREVAFLLFTELALLTVVAIPLGMAMGYGLAALLIRFSYDTELFRMPLVINRSTYGFAAIVTLAAALGSGLIVRRMLDRLDLVAVLKSKE